MKSTTPWLNTLKRNVEQKITNVHTSVTRESSRPTSLSSDALARPTDNTDSRLLGRNEPLAREALLDLLKNEREWRSFFKSCCERSSRLTAQTWQFRDELRDRGHHFQTEEVGITLLDLARDLLPESAAAQWDAEWSHALCKDALSRLALTYDALSAEEKDALDLAAQHEWDERMATASLDNDPAAFRAALEGWERAGLEAMNRARVKGGAA